MGDKDPKIEEAPELCGHVNLHSFGADGKPDEPSCDLPDGHDGAHSADHFERGKFNAMVSQDLTASVEEVVLGHRTVRDKSGNEIAVPVMGYEGNFRTYWEDMAGIPVSEIKPVRKDAPFGGELTGPNEPIKLMDSNRINEVVSNLNPTIAPPQE